jgi:hypothetical protein
MADTTKRFCNTWCCHDINCSEGNLFSTSIAFFGDYEQVKKPLR